MKKLHVSTVLVVFALSALFLNLYAGEEKVLDKTFKPAELVKIKVVSGDCVVKKGTKSEIKVHVVYTYPEDKYKPVFKHEGNTLVLSEEFAKDSCNLKGKSSWTVTVPAKTDIECKAASGDITVTGLSSKVETKTASGDVEVSDYNGKLVAKAASGDVKVTKAGGDLHVSAASGDIALKDVKGILDVKCASGDIKVSGVVFAGASSVKGVSGDVVVTLAKTNEYDLNLATVSGSITLDYNGNPVKGYFEFKGQKGNVHSDIPFDSKKESEYVPFTKMHFQRGGDSPKVSLKTLSGKLTFKK